MRLQLDGTIAAGGSSTLAVSVDNPTQFFVSAPCALGTHRQRHRRARAGRGYRRRPRCAGGGRLADRVVSVAAVVV